MRPILARARSFSGLAQVDSAIEAIFFLTPLNLVVPELRTARRWRVRAGAPSAFQHAADGAPRGRIAAARRDGRLATRPTPHHYHPISVSLFLSLALAIGPLSHLKAEVDFEGKTAELHPWNAQKAPEGQSRLRAGEPCEVGQCVFVRNHVSRSDLSHRNALARSQGVRVWRHKGTVNGPASLGNKGSTLTHTHTHRMALLHCFSVACPSRPPALRQTFWKAFGGTNSPGQRLRRGLLAVRQETRVCARPGGAPTPARPVHDDGPPWRCAVGPAVQRAVPGACEGHRDSAPEALEAVGAPRGDDDAGASGCACLDAAECARSKRALLLGSLFGAHCKTESCELRHFAPHFGCPGGCI